MASQACVFDGYINIPMYKMPYNVTATDSGSHPYRFRPNGNAPFMARAVVDGGGNLTAMQSYLCNIAGLTDYSLAGSLAIPSNIEMIWAGGKFLYQNPINSGIVAGNMPRQIAATTFSPLASVAAIGAPGSAFLGPYELIGPNGAYQGFTFGGINIDVATPGGGVFYAYQNTCFYPGGSNQGNTFEGQDGALGYTGWYQNVGSRSSLYNIAFGPDAATPPVACMYLIPNTFRPRRLCLGSVSPQAAVPANLWGAYVDPVFDNAAMETSAQNGSSEFLCYKNGYTATLNVPDLSLKGSQWTFIVMNFEMTKYRILYLADTLPEVKTFLASNAAIPSVKVDTDGTVYMMAGTGTGLIYSSFTPNLMWNPQPITIPPATFALPCFDNCEPDAYCFGD